MNDPKKIPLSNTKANCIVERVEESLQRKFLVTTDNSLARLVPIKQDEGFITEIVGLRDGEKVLFEKGKTFEYAGEPFLVKSIVSTGVKNKYHVCIDVLNPTSLFILPLLGYTRDTFCLKTLLVNSFIRYELDILEDYPSIYLLYRFTDSEEFKKLESFLRNYGQFSREFHPDPYHILYKLHIPSHFLKDFHLILRSKYSEISDKAKKNILSFHGLDINNRTSNLSGILYKTNKRRQSLEKALGTYIPLNAELFEFFDIDNNTYRPHIYDDEQGKVS